jgi:hypothetical protein
MPRLVPVRVVAAAAGMAAATAAVTAFAALGAGVTPAGAASTPSQSASSEYTAALAAAKNKSVHFVSVVDEGGVTLHVTGDAGSTSGQQTLTVQNGKTTEHMTAEIVGSNGYINGNSNALHNVIGLSTSASNKNAGKWLSFPTSNSGLAQLVAGLLKSQVDGELGLSSPYSYGSEATVNGQQAVAIKGQVSTSSGGKVSEVLYVPKSGKPLPIEEVTNPGSTSKSSIHGSVSFSNWGESASIKAPSKSTSLLKLAPASSSGATTTTGG